MNVRNIENSDNQNYQSIPITNSESPLQGKQTSEIYSCFNTRNFLPKNQVKQLVFEIINEEIISISSQESFYKSALNTLSQQMNSLSSEIQSLENSPPYEAPQIDYSFKFLSDSANFLLKFPIQTVYKIKILIKNSTLSSIKDEYKNAFSSLEFLENHPLFPDNLSSFLGDLESEYKNFSPIPDFTRLLGKETQNHWNSYLSSSSKTSLAGAISYFEYLALQYREEEMKQLIELLRPSTMKMSENENSSLKTWGECINYYLKELMFEDPDYSLDERYRLIGIFIQELIFLFAHDKHFSELPSFAKTGFLKYWAIYCALNDFAPNLTIFFDIVDSNNKEENKYQLKGNSKALLTEFPLARALSHFSNIDEGGSLPRFSNIDKGESLSITIFPEHVKTLPKVIDYLMDLNSAHLNSETIEEAIKVFALCNYFGLDNLESSIFYGFTEKELSNPELLESAFTTNNRFLLEKIIDAFTEEELFDAEVFERVCATEDQGSLEKIIVRSFQYAILSKENFEKIYSLVDKHKPSITSLDLTNYYIKSGSRVPLTDYEMKLCIHFSKLKVLNLSLQSSITDESLKYLKDLKELVDLNLRHCKKITDRGINYFSDNPTLTKLDLSYCWQVSVNSIKNIKSLTSLILEFWKLNRDDFKQLTSLTKLRSLSLKWNLYLDKESLEEIAKISSLTELNLKDCVYKPPDAINSLSSLSHLKIESDL
jgi:hypothetical protein